MARHGPYLMIVGTLALLSGCASAPWVEEAPVGAGLKGAQLTPVSASHADLTSLPPPAGKIMAAVYAFRDQTGQYKPQPDSSFSTAVTQGAASMLVRALLDSGWFIPLEREGLQSLLTERKILRAPNHNSEPALPSLMGASILLEGGIVAYETNVKTGGAGARYFGIGASEVYRTDQVTVALRAVDVRTGRILNSVTTTKTIYSRQLDAGVFRFVRFKRLLELEAGFTRNEPAQLCVLDAIEAAVTHLIVQGIEEKAWALKNPADMASATVQSYLSADPDRRSQPALAAAPRARNLNATAPPQPNPSQVSVAPLANTRTAANGPPKANATAQPNRTQAPAPPVAVARTATPRAPNSNASAPAQPSRSLDSVPPVDRRAAIDLAD